MKFVIINDTHAGVSNSSDAHLDAAEEFYSTVLFPYMLEHDLKHIVHLGDFFDNRRVINAKCLKHIERVFLDKLVEYDITMDIILGNHDVYYKSTNKVSATESILMRHPNVDVIREPIIRDYDGLNIALLPWINQENHDDSIKFISESSSKARILFGHLELGGFSMMKNGMKSSTEHGMSIGLFEKYETVLTGHFHTKSTMNNITYVGTQLEFTWSDCNDPKAFHVFDTAQPDNLLAVPNPNKLFIKLHYDDTDKTDASEFPELKQQLKNKFVKVIVEHKENPVLFDTYINQIDNQDPHDLKIHEVFDEYNGESVGDLHLETEDTLTILNKYVDAVDTPLDKSKIMKKLTALYSEALNKS